MNEVKYIRIIKDSPEYLAIKYKNRDREEYFTSGKVDLKDFKKRQKMGDMLKRDTSKLF